MQWRAPRGPQRTCRGWQQEGILRLLLNTLDTEVAYRPEEFLVYGSAKAVRDRTSLDALGRALIALGDDETLLVQSGRGVAVFPTHPLAPRLVMSTGMLVPHWATWQQFWALEKQGLTMYGQNTAAGWAYVGTQGLLQGTYETFAELARRHFGGTLAGRWVLTAGLGALGASQPLAVTMNGGVMLAAEVDAASLQHMLRKNMLDMVAPDLRTAVAAVREAVAARRPRAIGLAGNAADLYPELVRLGAIPDVVTDQTAAHDPLHGYLPAGLTAEEAARLRESDPQGYIRRATRSIAVQVQAMLDMTRHGAIAFDYGNNLREQAAREGVAEALQMPGFVQAYIRPLLVQGRGPFRWVALSGDPEDIYKLDQWLLEGPAAADPIATRWLTFAREQLWFEGLPARVCWLDYETRVRFGQLVNDAVAAGKLAAPIAITRDHLDVGAMASPFRETEGMPDGSDAIADWPVLNAMLNCAAGATLVSLGHGGSVGIGYSIHAGMTVVADGTAGMGERLRRILAADAGLGLVRLDGAGYPGAAAPLTQYGVRPLGGDGA
ncbi:MAG TPA: urocanate hydratase [Symbiobacteriaceae bacterium]|nr:urocanate hydratase [Symbiobacteriaceae bacterium]